MNNHTLPRPIGCYELANHLRAAACQYHDDGMAIRAQIDNPENISNRAGLRRALEQFERQWSDVQEIAGLLETFGPTALALIDA